MILSMISGRIKGDVKRELGFDMVRLTRQRDPSARLSSVQGHSDGMEGE